MRKWTGRLSAALAALALAACGSGGGADTTSTRERLAGTWRLVQQSTDGGQNYTDYAGDFSFTFVKQGVWTDSEDDAGVWSINGSQLTIKHADNQADEHALFALELSDNQLRLRRTDASFVATGRISVYQRVVE